MTLHSVLCSTGFLLSSVDEDGIRRLYVSSVKETGLASKKGKAVGAWGVSVSVVLFYSLVLEMGPRCTAKAGLELIVWLGLLLTLSLFASASPALGSTDLPNPFPDLTPCGPCLSHSFPFGLFSLVNEKDIFRRFVYKEFVSFKTFRGSGHTP